MAINLFLMAAASTTAPLVFQSGTIPMGLHQSGCAVFSFAQVRTLNLPASKEAMTTQDSILNQDRTRRPLQDAATRLGNRFADLLTGAHDESILNPQPWSTGLEQPARALFQAARALKAEAIDVETGLVDYEILATSDAYARLQKMTRTLPSCLPSDLPDRDTRIAFWINLYNTLLIDAVVHFQIQRSLLGHPWVFRRAAYNVEGMRFSADAIEHGILRGNRPRPTYRLRPFTNDDPRIAYTIDPPDARLHFSLVCGAKSCPPIAFYENAHLDEQLDIAASNLINGGGARYDRNEHTLWLSKIFQWYKGDFGGREGVLALIRRHLNAPIETRNEALKIRYLPYDWFVNALV